MLRCRLSAKIVAVGSLAVGKTSLLWSHTAGGLPSDWAHWPDRSRVFGSYANNIMLDGQRIHFGPWDTKAGEVAQQQQSEQHSEQQSEQQSELQFNCQLPGAAASSSTKQPQPQPQPQPQHPL